MAIAAIACAHDVSDETSPTIDRIVRECMRGLARMHSGDVVKQAGALTSECVATIRGHLNGAADASKRHALTLAIVSVMADAGLRRSEASALTWGDVAIADNGSGRVTIRRSKTDQAGEGAVVAITAAAVNDLQRLAGFVDADDDASIFGICAAQISRRITKAAHDAGLAGSFTGHSGRVGLAVKMTRNQAPTVAVMRQGRWQSARMISRYTRNERASEALRYL